LLRSPAGRELDETLTLKRLDIRFFLPDTIEIPMNEIQALAAEIRDFADTRNWGEFHTPKNLSMAVAGEAGELVAEFQWLTSEESFAANMTAEKFNAVELEIADVAIYLIRLADVLGVDLSQVVIRKLEINQSRF
jgi:NTP pyrophosphatase (non-canonical NTP hydrolase)